MDNFEKRWLKVEQMMYRKFQAKDIDSILFVIGVQELGEIREFSKSEKMDIINIGVSTLLSIYGYYKRVDHKDNFPMFKQIKEIDIENQVFFIKKAIIKYFNL